MAVGYVADITGPFPNDDCYRIFGITSATLSGVTWTFTTTGFGGVGHSGVSMLTAREIRLYAGSTQYPLAGEANTFTPGSSAFDNATSASSPSIGDQYYKIRFPGVSSI